MRKIIFTSAAIAALAFAGAAGAQVLGGGVGLGGGIGVGAGPNVGVGVTGSARGAASVAVPNAAAQAQARARADAKVRAQANPGVGQVVSGAARTGAGAAAVLPHTNASATGVTQGSLSATRSGADVNATTGWAIGTTVKDSRGATVGRVLRTVTAADGTARVVVQMGADTFTVPSTALTLNGRYATSAMTKAQLRAMARGSAAVR